MLMNNQNKAAHLKNTRQELIFSFLEFTDLTFWERIKTPNFCAIFLITEGENAFTFDGRTEAIKAQDILFYYPYQSLKFDINNQSIKGLFIQFHPDFFCLDIQGLQVACQGILFNNAFYGTLLKCTSLEINALQTYFYTILEEIDKKELSHLELIENTLRIFLINCVRIKIKQDNYQLKLIPENIQQLEQLLTQYLLKHHSVSFYATQMQMSPSTLNRLCHNHFNKSLSRIIEDKIVALAKKKLFLTNLSVKEISNELGFEDPFYFSRFFKKAVQLSPISYRNKLKYAHLDELSMQ
jgi:AraC family transcriptional regulator, transcriptional activator of pobA